jgi:hypothetical protein
VMMTSGKNVFCQKGKGYQIVLSFLRQTHGLRTPNESINQKN